jgi:hypothetical protein
MLRVLRRCRVLALTLLLATPGLGGTWLAVAHPCPVDMPWLAETGHGHEQTSHGHGQTSHGQAQTSHGHEGAPAGSSSCNCVSVCQSGTAALFSVRSSPTVLVAVGGWDSPPTSSDLDAPAQPRRHRHPPATAPPLA